MKKTIAIISIALALSSCNKTVDYVRDGVSFAGRQLPILVAESEPATGDTLTPHSLLEDGSVNFVNPNAWTSGFFAGSLWLMYDLTGDEYWAEHAKKHTEVLSSVQYLTDHHDVGFMIGSSYGQGLRLKGFEGYDAVIVQTAKSLCTRFRPAAGIIQSWNTETGASIKKLWSCPVIIDNMMNLELLFEATRISGDSTYANIAISHADKTMQNHFRPDNSSWHVLDYDTTTGEVLKRQTAQGFSDDSAWSRGQSWGLYGYTMCYRYTRNEKYLDHAKRIAEFLLGHKNMPSDMVPYWDFDSPDIPDTFRDVSSACVISSALYELFTFTGNASYKSAADRIVESLSNSPYRSEEGSNHGFLLQHSVTSIPHNAEIDKPLNYADYYYLEALCRKRNIENE